MSASRRLISKLAQALPVLAIGLAVSCTKTDVLTSPPDVSQGTLPALETRPMLAPQLSTLRASAPLIASCGPAMVFPMTDSRRTSGTVTVSNDRTNIYVTYATPTTYWWVANTQLAVKSSAAAIPRDESGAVSPWDFTDSGEHEPPIKSVTYTVPLSRVGVRAGQTAYVAAMSGVVHPVTESEAGLEGAWEWLVMWGVGNTTATTTEIIHAYTVASCDGTVITPPVVTAPGKGAVSITFDDGWLTTYTNAYPVLRDLGIKANAAVNPTPIDEGWSSYMKPAQVQALWNAGWSVISHTMDHEDLTTLTPAAMEAEIRDSKDWIVAKGYGPSSAFVVPFHSWGPRERTMIAKYHTYVRGHTIDEFQPERYATWPVTQPMDINAFEPEFAPYRSAKGRELTMSKIKYAVDNGLYLDLMFHEIPVATLPQFRDLMTQIATKYKANIVTAKDVAK